MLVIITQIVTVEHSTFVTTQNLPVVYYVVFPENLKCQNARNFGKKPNVVLLATLLPILHQTIHSGIN
jgi:predicted glycosyltransferase